MSWEPGEPSWQLPGPHEHTQCLETHSFPGNDLRKHGPNTINTSPSCSSLCCWLSHELKKCLLFEASEVWDGLLWDNSWLLLPHLTEYCEDQMKLYSLECSESWIATKISWVSQVSISIETKQKMETDVNSAFTPTSPHHHPSLPPLPLSSLTQEQAWAGCYS